MAKNQQYVMVSSPRRRLKGACQNLGYLKPRVFRDNFPLSIISAESRLQIHIIAFSDLPELYIIWQYHNFDEIYDCADARQTPRPLGPGGFTWNAVAEIGFSPR
jgi:hypothetical protein